MYIHDGQKQVDPVKDIWVFEMRGDDDYTQIKAFGFIRCPTYLFGFYVDTFV
jgi:hypothetical protein